MVWPTAEMAARHYEDLSSKPFFEGLVKFFSSGPIVCMCWEGKDVIKQGRQMLGEYIYFTKTRLFGIEEREL